MELQRNLSSAAPCSHGFGWVLLCLGNWPHGGLWHIFLFRISSPFLSLRFALSLALLFPFALALGPIVLLLAGGRRPFQRQRLGSSGGATALCCPCRRQPRFPAG